jgi:chaperonin GroEL
VKNIMGGRLQAVAVKTPSYGNNKTEILKDVCSLTGAKFFDALAVEGDVTSATLEDLGKVSKVSAGFDTTILFQGGGKSQAIQERITLIKAQIKNAKSDFDVEKLRDRLGKLTGGVAIINVGADTESEMKEKKDRVDDALHATRAAIEEGIVAGGGTALLCVQSSYPKDYGDFNGDEAHGFMIVRTALEAPLRQIVFNVGSNADEVVSQWFGEGSARIGYNAVTGQLEDLIESGVIDPAKVTKSALKNAASIAGLLLTTECSIVNK